MKRIYAVSIIIILALLFGACNKSTDKETNAIITPVPEQLPEGLTTTPVPDIAAEDNTAQENSSDNSPTPSDVNPTTDNTTDLTYDISEVSYLSDDSIKIFYPQVVHLGNQEVQDKINEIIRLAAMRYTEGFDASQENNQLDNDYIITFKGSRLLSLQFIGYRNEATSAYPSSFSYTVNINLNTGETVKLTDMIKVDDSFLQIIKEKGSGKYLYFDNNRELMEDESFNEPDISSSIKNNIFNGDYTYNLAGADSEGAEVFCYFTEDALGISFNTIHVLGDHIQYELSYSDIADYINKDNSLWDAFSQEFQIDSSDTATDENSEKDEFVLDENLIWKNINYVSGFYVIKDQSFPVNLENWGDVYFIAGGGEGEFALNSLYLYLADKNSNILYEFPYFYGNGMMFSNIAAISFQDVNSDGLKDIIVIAYYMTGVGPTGAEEYPIADVYFQTGQGFVTIPQIAEQMNSSGFNDSISKVVEYLSDKELKLN